MPDELSIIIRQKDNTLWHGHASSLSSTNEIGTFDILPSHANFIGIVEKFIIVRTQKETKEWPITRGIISVSGDGIEVYLDY